MLLFASAKEAVGAAEVKLPASRASTVRELTAALAEASAELVTQPDSMTGNSHLFDSTRSVLRSSDFYAFTYQIAYSWQNTFQFVHYSSQCVCVCVFV